MQSHEGEARGEGVSSVAILSPRNHGREVQQYALGLFVSGRKYICFLGLWANLLLSISSLTGQLVYVCDAWGTAKSAAPAEDGSRPSSPTMPHSGHQLPSFRAHVATVTGFLGNSGPIQGGAATWLKPPQGRPFAGDGDPPCGGGTPPPHNSSQRAPGKRKTLSTEAEGGGKRPQCFYLAECSAKAKGIVSI